jgi:hypothetical protein
MLIFKKIVFQYIQLFDFFILLVAFLYGNLFVLTCSNYNWDMTFLFFIVLFLEFLNKILYFIFSKKVFFKDRPVSKDDQLLSFQGKKQKSLGLFFRKQVVSRKKRSFSSTLSFLEFAIIFNILKRGFLLGFFVEGFKVGS